MKEQPYWWETISRRQDARSHVQTVAGRKLDVLVVGAGYTGLSAARQLARSGAAVAVVERDRVGSGASSRNGGQILTGLKVGPSTLVARYGDRRARQLFEASIHAIATTEEIIEQERIECGYERTGHIQAAAKPAHFKAFRDEQQLLSRLFGHRVELVSREQQASELGSAAYHGLLVDERSGALNPAQYVEGLAEAARRAGACVVEQSEVTTLRRDGSRWRVTTSTGEIEARDVLMATDGGGPLNALARRVVPVGSYIIATEPLSQSLADALLPKRRMAFDSKHFLYYFRLTGDRRLLFGGRAEFSRPTEASGRRAAGILRRGMAQVFPELERTSIEYAWCGTVMMTRDQMPRAGRLGDVWYAGGYCGHGVAMATYLGGLVARRMAGESIEHPLLDDKWAAIPFYTGRPWFLPAVGAYYRLLDHLD